LIRKCLTVSPAKRFTVDDIATHTWVNHGYKHPPVHYYLTSVMKKNGTMISSHPPPVANNGTIKTTSMMSERISKSMTPPVPTLSIAPPPPPPVIVPPPPVQSKYLTDTESKSKSKPTTNGHHQTIRSHRLNVNTVTNNNKNGTLKTHQSSRRTSKERHNVGISSPSKHPPLRPMVY
jgi:hypothetical protein